MPMASNNTAGEFGLLCVILKEHSSYSNKQAYGEQGDKCFA